MSTKKKFAFEVIDEVDANDIVSLLVTAFDSGATNYWAPEAEVHLPDDFDVLKIEWLKNPEEWARVRKVYLAPLIEGGSVVLFDEMEDGKRCILDLRSIEQGVQAMAQKYPHHWRDFRMQNDDAITGDVFVQCCVFGDVIYG